MLQPFTDNGNQMKGKYYTCSKPYKDSNVSGQTQVYIFQLTFTKKKFCGTSTLNFSSETEDFKDHYSIYS